MFLPSSGAWNVQLISQQIAQSIRNYFLKLNIQISLNDADVLKAVQDANGDSTKLQQYIIQLINNLAITNQLICQPAFLLINDYKNWAQWSPYEHRDPALLARGVRRATRLPSRLALVNFGLWLACTTLGSFGFRHLFGWTPMDAAIVVALAPIALDNVDMAYRPSLMA